ISRTLWEFTRAPVFALALALFLYGIRNTPVRIPNPATVLLVFTVFATYNWRLRDGLTTGLVAVVFTLTFYAGEGGFFEYSAEHWRGMLAAMFAAIVLMTVLAASKQRLSEALDAERKARASISTILESITDGFVAIDRDWRFTYVNSAAEKMLGRSRAEMVGQLTWDVLPGTRDSVFYQNYRRAMEEGVPIAFEAQSLVVNKRFEVHGYPSDNGISVYFRDVTERYRAQEALRISEERYRELFENANDLLYTHDLQGNFTSVNNACVTTTGYSQGELLEMNLADLVAPEHLELAGQMMRHKVRQGGPTTYELSIVARDGRHVPVEVSTRLVVEKGRAVGVQGIARDISERKLAEAALRNMSLTDPLTGVYNRRGAATLADQQLKVAQRLGRSMLLLYADLNDLKQINDTQGHAVGDAALVETAQILQETFRESDVIARMGGDEFIVLAMETAGSNAETLRNRLLEKLRDRNAQRGRRYHLSVAVGVARFDPMEARDLDELVAEADRKMYVDKRQTVLRL
ncbi:MAG TPA: PAS domain S-box protein, partial [Longimicrobiales bacterium]|nr:PAS domain S-box protein [Longimicrobiales bacterium]